nr:lipase member I-like isoform X1 [Dermacentor andersoni]XP_054928345.1 lipase member I-like isoform X1 [Dermacentor andersoni]XP_054928346.1 lipase member I-like isoform X1 [Dermacentor andersoni]
MKVMKITRTHLLAYYAAVTFALHYASAVEDTNCKYEEGGGVPPANVDVSGKGWDEYVVNQTLRLMEFAKEVQNAPPHWSATLIAALEKTKGGKCSRGPGLQLQKLKESFQSVNAISWFDLTKHNLEDMKALLNAKLGRFPCYKGVACFNPKKKMSLEIAGPDSPEEIGTKITFFGKGARKGVVVSDATWPNVMEKRRWNVRRPLVAIIHGFTEDGQRPWVISLKDSLVRYARSNVLIVDWNKGATYPYYLRAARNTPVPGVQLSLLIQKIIHSSKHRLSPNSVHVVGFSLGAQVAGFCGRHFHRAFNTKLGRITGLDPAGPLFENSMTCISKSDAQFVDAIHVNAGEYYQFRYGVNKSVGHVDFYPNGGSDQPGCPTAYWARFDACSHDRAPPLFIESLTNQRCTFKSLKCKRGWPAYLSGHCQKRRKVYDGEMGYRSLLKKGRGNQYLKTRANSPYCISLFDSNMNFTRILIKDAWK